MTNDVNVTNTVIITVRGKDEFVPLSRLDLNYEASNEQVLEAVRPLVLEVMDTDIKDDDGSWLFKTIKTEESQNIYVIPNLTAGQQTQATPQVEGKLSYLENEERHKAFQSLVSGCTHLWSKGKPQWDLIQKNLNVFAILAKQDPYFLAHFNSYVMKKSDNRDLQILTTFANSLSDADGTPVMLGSSYKKPNLRQVAQAAVQQLDIKQLHRLLTLANTKLQFNGDNKVYHMSKHLRTAARKYIRFREHNPKSIEGIVKAGLRPLFKQCFYKIHLSPKDTTASLMQWKQKDKEDIKLAESSFKFEGLSDYEIAVKIRDENLKPLPVLGALDRKISPVIAAAILEQSTPDQAVILANQFGDQSILADEEVSTVFKEKISKAKTALDRVERINRKNTELAEKTNQIMKKAKSEKRKTDIGNLGKVFVHIDASSSMDGAIELVKEHGATIAECIQDPQNNFNWGWFNSKGYPLPKPKTFEKDAFMHALYGLKAGGWTDCMALYLTSRKLGTDTEIFVSDQLHTNHGWMALQNRGESSIFGGIRKARELGYPDPKLVVCINVKGHHGVSNHIKNGFTDAGIPVVEIESTALNNSALISETIKNALLGPLQIIDDIMDTKLLTLPRWWNNV